MLMVPVRVVLRDRKLMNHVEIEMLYLFFISVYFPSVMVLTVFAMHAWVDMVAMVNTVL